MAKSGARGAPMNHMHSLVMEWLNPAQPTHRGSYCTQPGTTPDDHCGSGYAPPGALGGAAGHQRSQAHQSKGRNQGSSDCMVGNGRSEQGLAHIAVVMFRQLIAQGGEQRPLQLHSEAGIVRCRGASPQRKRRQPQKVESLAAIHAEQTTAVEMGHFHTRAPEQPSTSSTTEPNGSSSWAVEDSDTSERLQQNSKQSPGGDD